MARHSLYRDREHAGRVLADALRSCDLGHDPIVLALPRGGVPLGRCLADALGLDLDVLLVRKLGHPLQPELAVGAIASGGGRVLNEDVAEHLESESIQRVEHREWAELERRERAFRGERPRPNLAGRGVVLVDDGVATGSTMRAAARAVRGAADDGPTRVTLAVPLAPAASIEALEAVADRVVCPETPEPFTSIGQWYARFDQLNDDEVRAALNAAWS